MIALVDPGAECSLIHGDFQKLSGPLSDIGAYRGYTVIVRKVFLTPKIGHPPSNVFLSLQDQRTYWTLISRKVKFCKPLLVNSASGLESLNQC